MDTESDIINKHFDQQPYHSTWINQDKWSRYSQDPYNFSQSHIDMNRDSASIAYVFAGFCIAAPLVQKFILGPIARLCVTRLATKHRDEKLKSAKGSKVPSSKKGKEYEREIIKVERKFVHSAWKFICYAFFVMYGIYAVLDQQDWFWDPTKYHSIERVLNFYYLETGFYLFSLVAIFFEPALKDRYQMFIHHVVTVILLGSSYYFNSTKYGVPIMLLHDVADPFMEAAKMCLYSNARIMADVLFVCFMIVFIYLRDWVFPRYIILQIWSKAAEEVYPFYWPTVICLTSLWVLHLFWTVLIFKVCKETLIGRSNKGDVREED